LLANGPWNITLSAQAHVVILEISAVLQSEHHLGKRFLKEDAFPPSIRLK
jgi:hypothetical protein